MFFFLKKKNLKLDFKYRNYICGNKIKLVSSKKLLQAVKHSLQTTELTCFQKFVKSNGSKAFICRTVWRKDKNPYCWIITNKNDFYANEKIGEQQKYVTNVEIINSQFVADFIKDESGIWWLINIKSFTFEQPIPKEIDTKQITHYGDFNIQIKQKNIGTKNIVGQKDLTYKILIQMHFIKNMQYVICALNFILKLRNLFKMNLILQKCQVFNVMKKPNAITLDLIKIIQMEKINCVLDLGLNVQLSINDNFPMISNKVQINLDRFRIMILLQYLRDIPLERDQNANYYVEYIIFEQKTRYKIDLNISQTNCKSLTCFIPLNKIKILYFFSQQRDGLHQYITEKQYLTMSLYQENTKIGSLDIQLKDFLNEQVIKNEYYKFFSGKSLPILKWGINLTIGVFNSKQIDVTRINLKYHHGVYLPNVDYYTCEPLPIEWIQLISQKEDIKSHEDNENVKVKEKNLLYMIIFLK
ncbi:lmbr1-like conserved region family protein, putative [Ichthyophthirius multifiliis]|uniref:Lmbr1-like conserved region family protein, putative n=1 Tax=Ichthyophthirius multifiliis TaxID=5932 RepID=G0QNF1_ICHMU|nr:lmbr1-like conserved region family protein, putative [Ichthyophthirius multifiliis]EGR33256.1 lmbr1-like conserved region family protein, putative [Ichthyophthirius multifiliis]|eukprot:XP_004037242.1 lmbr1-like conserved region family protein, putative [Ichthyophthirius multifiliis]